MEVNHEKVIFRDKAFHVVELEKRGGSIQRQLCYKVLLLAEQDGIRGIKLKMT